MQLNRRLILEKHTPETFNAPDAAVFDLPEKVLQFGTGVLLRGLPDFYIDKANKQHVFNGRVVVIKSTGEDVGEFTKQDGLYTQCVKGIVDGKDIEEYIINAAISKVLAAQQSWHEIMQYAESAAMQIIISNTTEVGIELKEDDDINAAPPQSFPGKLLAFLYKRFQHFNGSPESGIVIIPTELITDNGKKLKKIVLQLAAINKLDTAFVEWLDTANDFCDSLVDRIVPGALKKQNQLAFEQKAGYKDTLTIMSEPYSLWAIESSSERTKEILSFYTTDKSVIITPDINKYRELKLRLLNATHTFSCALAYLAGFDLVYESMREEAICNFIKKLMTEEIADCIIDETITRADTASFAANVIDRFCNAYIEHKWLSISMNYTAKIKMRCLPLILSYYKKTGKVPSYMSAGFAAYILFTKPVEIIDGVYYGRSQNRKYKIDDPDAALFYSYWQNDSADTVAQKILSNESLWDIDLTSIPGFAALVQYFLQQFNRSEFKYVITRLSYGGKVSNEA
ncbi:tagaturonate reductase [Parafilimonas terrae]|uniref:Tagaturonate reductase n=1 Tax=Parafilimonas terrae TaxID=1465490 RepID=A0A1I5TQ65_9BACT|nr:tagaturonate reductase [Parafilimonas terrae]SFP85202.1 tagaturonate reductase [Parafilimonas terrae]